MNILVTGGAGYIGSHTCVELLNNYQAQGKPFARTPGVCEQNVNDRLKGYENGTFDVKE